MNIAGTRFPFAYPCRDVSARSVITCFTDLFSIFGLPAYVHSDRGSSLVSKELQQYLHSRGVATSHTTPYNPRGNGQCEKFNGTIWRAVTLALKSRGLEPKHWEQVLVEAMHSIRTLLNTATNETPHERMFSFTRKTSFGTALPTWLSTPGPVYLKKHVVGSKYDPRVDEVELIQANPSYAHIRFPTGREATVSLRDLAPVGEAQRPGQQEDQPVSDVVHESGQAVAADEPDLTMDEIPSMEIRRSSRVSKPPDRLGISNATDLDSLIQQGENEL